MNRWRETGWGERYLAERHEIPHRQEGMAVLVELLAPAVGRVLDLGTGDGVTLAGVLAERPGARGVGLDFSPDMLERAARRFGGDERVELVAHDLDEPLPASLGTFDLVVSSFAVHHCVDERKRALYREVFDALAPGGTFLNLEHVASPTTELHLEFLAALGRSEVDDDPSNMLAPVEDQLGWLRTIGFEHVDCMWKWRELALLAARKPTVV
ncbi:MAG: class I SAM-dependent methyltransferase [Acidimicrobiia bacterium]